LYDHPARLSAKGRANVQLTTLGLTKALMRRRVAARVETMPSRVLAGHYSSIASPSEAVAITHAGRRASQQIDA
jgi:hypothetical protein